MTNNNSWQAQVAILVAGCGCPYCSGIKALVGYNDLATANPELADEWDYDKNGDLKPEMVKQCTNKKVWWKCREGHSWQAVINSRSSGSGCPYCIGKVQMKMHFVT